MSGEITIQGMFDDITPVEQEDCYVGLPGEIIASLEHRALKIQDIVHVAILEVGKELKEARQEIAPYKDGGFKGWVERKTNFTEAYAYQLMDTYENFKGYTKSIVSQFSGTSMRILSLPNVPQSARDEAVQRAEQGEAITVKLSKEIAEEHKARKEAEEKAEKAQNQVDLFTTLVKEKQEQVDELSQQIKDLEEKLKNAQTPPVKEVIPQATQDKIANLEALTKKQKERNNMLSDEIEKLREELKNQRDANEARRKHEKYVFDIKNGWKKATDAIYKALNIFNGEIPSPISMQVFEGDEWAKYDLIAQSLQHCKERLITMQSARYGGEQFIDSPFLVNVPAIVESD